MSDLEARGARYRPLVQREMRAVIGDEPDGLHAWMRYHLGWEDRAGRPVEASPGKMLRPLPPGEVVRSRRRRRWN